jgi:rod shape-determining protein MreC
MKWTSGRLYRNRKLLLTVSGLVIPLLLSALLLGEKTFVTSLIHGVFYSPFWALSNKVTSLLHVYKDNVDLQAQIVRLKFQERRNELDRIENKRYRDMLLLLPRDGYRMIPADVVAYDQGRRLSTAVIKASEEMERFRAVVDENGIVGKISSTSGTTATVSLLVGPNCRVAARDVRTQALGIVKWYSGRGLYFDDVALDADVEQGDTLVSSGLGGVFPEGIYIGVVDTIETSSSAFFKQIRIDPFVDFGSLDVVMVMEPVEATPGGF